MASLTIRPGSRVRLKGQDDHVPDFLVVRCDRDRCWIRQEHWAPDAELNISFKQLWVPPEAGATLPLALAEQVKAAGLLATHGDYRAGDNVVYMAAFRRRHAPQSQ
ncbi:hypothetical protein IQ254_10045 [Nodosilinea sp. LEGE 07088]|uniref:hypothetical protein n=1 Tax=Nodosilinea sp. LEGE 07088 TaxID=2777968 RepID=UPI0018802F30|nr:hypothetical protein [Nodosilinea sp. LEGE 07088]MBE9137548.1 hypothetical protein [Nodosilinea sp. LEGE 07088]